MKNSNVACVFLSQQASIFFWGGGGGGQVASDALMCG